MRQSATALAIVLAALAACGGGSAGGATIGSPIGGTPPSPPPPSPPPPSPPPPPTPASFTPSPAARGTTGPTLPLGKCVNLSNMLEAPNEGDWGRAFRDDDATNIHAAGFATVRLPIRFAAHAATSPPYTIDPAFMARVRHVLEANVAAGLNVILDMHNYDELMADPAGQRARFAALWQQVAAEFRDQPDNVWFELMNEPNGDLNDSTLAATFAPALAAVRASNPDRIVIVGGQNWSGIDSLATSPIPDDPHIVVTFHYYDPFDFTHQGATWINPVLPTGRQFGTVEHVLQVPEEDLFDGIVTATDHGLRFVDAGQVGAITTERVQCDIGDEDVANLPAPEGSPVYSVDALQDTGDSLHDRLGRLFRRPRWTQGQ